jgi:competence protein ComEC
MLSIGLFPAFALIAGAATALVLSSDSRWWLWLALATSGAAIPAWAARAPRVTTVALAVGFWAAGALLTADAQQRALQTSLRYALDQEFGGFLVGAAGQEGGHPPLQVRAILTEDAVVRDTYVSLRARVLAIRIRGEWRPVEGAVIVSVGGDPSLARAGEWRGGRTIFAPMTFRRPARYLNEGVPDFERDLALDGITLLASVKSGLLVDVVARGSALAEGAAHVRAYVRAVMTRWVAPHDQVSAAIATAVLIGDRGGLPDETRDRLQAAGTYHVIAISGGNIAILAACVTGLLAAIGLRGRRASLPAMVMLTAYALVATSGPSVWRATLMALLYFGARALDHRVPVWHATAVAAALMVVVRPLDVRDPGFVLTFGATTALIEGASRGFALQSRHRVLAWLLASISSSCAVEVALLPVSAEMFSRVTSAGLVLNLLAVPLTVVIQVAAIAAVVFDRVAWLAKASGSIASASAVALVRSADLVTIAPWLSARVPSPGVAVIVAYYAALVAALAMPRLRLVATFTLAALMVVIGAGMNVDRVSRDSRPAMLRLTMIDVGQGEGMLLETPTHESIVIDTGGSPFGGGVDIGQRVLAPALWARGIRSLAALLVTHGDPDHIGGALAVVDDFAPTRIWEGIRVPMHQPSELLADAARRHRIDIRALRAGQEMRMGEVRLRVLNPPAPDWERRRVRNDDSVVIEVTYRDVVLLLTGDIDADVERALIPFLSAARVRVLKVAHHGSRTSTSQQLLDAWQPQIALISCGRGNRFGHPTAEVLQRLETSGATVLRTDRDGEITLETDGQVIRATTYVGHESHEVR